MHAKADFRSRDGRYILMRTAARFSNDTGKSLLWKDLPARLDNKVFEKRFQHHTVRATLKSKQSQTLARTPFRTHAHRQLSLLQLNMKLAFALLAVMATGVQAFGGASIGAGAAGAGSDGVRHWHKLADGTLIQHKYACEPDTTCLYESQAVPLAPSTDLAELQKVALQQFTALQGMKMYTGRPMEFARPVCFFKFFFFKFNLLHPPLTLPKPTH